MSTVEKPFDPREYLRPPVRLTPEIRAILARSKTYGNAIWLPGDLDGPTHQEAALTLARLGASFNTKDVCHEFVRPIRPAKTVLQEAFAASDALPAQSTAAGPAEPTTIHEPTGA
jgi:hypothetical protein